VSVLSAVSGALIEKVKEQDKTIKKHDTKIKSLEEHLSKLEKLISEKFKD
jgi:flagellar capping protein FliD